MKKQNNLIGKHQSRPVHADDQSLEEHMHVIGGTGSGKSVFLKNQITQDIAKGKGVCLIDPHGELFKDVLKWLAVNPTYASTRKIHLADFTEPQLALKFNPLAYGNGDPTVAASNCTKAVSIAWQEDLTQTPQLKEVLQNIFEILVKENLTLREANIFLDIEKKAQRQAITKKYSSVFWNNIDAMRDIDFQNLTASGRRRINDFMDNQMLSAVFGQSEYSIDFQQCMEQGEIVLINLSTQTETLSDEQSRLIGCLLVNALLRGAKKRDKGEAEKNPFYLYIDEIQNYFSADIEKVLTEARKFGLFMRLAHQNLGQLHSVNQALISAIMGSATTKAYFGEVEYDEAVWLTKNAFKKINLKEVKHEQKSPVTVGHKREIFESGGESEGEGEAEMEGDSFTEAEGSTDSEGESHGTNSSSGSGESTSNASARGTAQMTASGSGNQASSGQVFNPNFEEQGIFFDTNDPVMTSENTGANSFQSNASSSSQSKMKGASKNNFASTGESFSQTKSRANSRSSANTQSTARTKNTNRSTNKGWQEGLVPVIKERVANTTFYSLNEQFHRNAEKLRNLRVGEFLYKTRSMTEPIKVKAPYTQEKPTGLQIKQLKIACFKDSNYIETTKRLSELVSKRERAMLASDQEPPTNLRGEDFLE